MRNNQNVVQRTGDGSVAAIDATICVKSPLLNRRNIRRTAAAATVGDTLDGACRAARSRRAKVATLFQTVVFGAFLPSLLRPPLIVICRCCDNCQWEGEMEPSIISYHHHHFLHSLSLCSIRNLSLIPPPIGELKSQRDGRKRRR